MKELRIVERKEGNSWVRINFSELQQGDVFRMFESTDEPVLDENNKTIWIATSNAYRNRDTIWTVDIM